MGHAQIQRRALAHCKTCVLSCLGQLPDLWEGSLYIEETHTLSVLFFFCVFLFLFPLEGGGCFHHPGKPSIPIRVPIRVPITSPRGPGREPPSKNNKEIIMIISDNYDDSGEVGARKEIRSRITNNAGDSSFVKELAAAIWGTRQLLSPQKLQTLSKVRHSR